MPDLPSGTVTFLFTDIEGSTALWERNQVARVSAVARHLTLLRTAVEAREGVLFKVVGDAVQARFPQPLRPLLQRWIANGPSVTRPDPRASDRFGSAWPSIPRPPRRKMATTSLRG